MAARLEFMFGAAGSGKSAELTRRLVASLRGGSRELLVVPEQNAVSAESRLAELTEGTDVSRLEVVNFTRLCNLIFRRYGGLAYNYAGAGARTVAMWRTLDELSGLLAEYKITPENSRRWAEVLLAEHTQLKTRGISPAMLEGAAQRLPQEHARLKNKLSDLALVGATYSRLLTELYDDPSDDIMRATELLRGQNFFGGCGLWLDAFDGFTREQYELIREMLRSAERVTAALCIPPDALSDADTPAFDTVRATWRTLRRLAADVGAEVGEPFVLRGLPRYKNKELARIAASLWDVGADIATPGNNSAPDGANAPNEAAASGEIAVLNGTAAPDGTATLNGTTAPDGTAMPNGVAASGDAAAQPAHIRIIECGDRYEEAELAAAEIARYVQGGGRWRDCAVIARNTGDYDGIIDAALERVGAPYFMSARTDVSSRPVVKLALAALAIVAGGWRWTDVVAMLRTGMAGVTPDECDTLEEYLSTWRVSGFRRWTAEYDWRMNPDGYSDVITPRGERILATVNAVRAKIVPPLAALAESFTPEAGAKTAGKQANASKANKLDDDDHKANGDIDRKANKNYTEKTPSAFGSEPSENAERGNIRRVSAALYRLLCELGVTERLAEKEGELAGQLWDALMGALDTVVTVAGGATVTADQFSQLFSTVLRQATVGRIPVSVDCVTVGQSDRLRTGEVKLAVLLGAAEGVFPGKTEVGGEVFTGSELQILREAGLDPCDDAEYLASSELFGFYRAAAAPSERLVVTFAGSARGFDGKEREAKPSSGVERLLAMFPGLEIEKFAAQPVAERIWSRESALETAVGQPETPEGKALRALLSADAETAALLESAARPLAEPEAQLSPELAAEVFRGDLALTQSRLDSYVMCAFGYYCRYMLELRERPVAEFGGADVGNFTHRVLERFMRAAFLPGGGLDPSLTREERGRLADSIIAEYLEAAFGHGEECSARAQNLFRRLRRTTLLVIENLMEEFSQSEFTPRWFELPIARGGETNGAPSVEPLRIPLPDGGAAYVYGKIDRVDAYRRNNDVYLRVVDYKTGTKKFSLSDLALGLNMQLLLYLFSLWNGGRRAAPESENVLPAGMLYMSAGSPRVDALPGEGADEINARAGESLKRSGILLDDEVILRAMERKLEEKYIPVKIKKDGAISSALPLEDVAGFGRLMREAESTVAAIGGNMKRGRASAEPLRDNRHDACEYCPYGPVCRSRKK